MGIPGLLPSLASVTRPAHIQEYKGKTVAVDAYVWLHRGAYACSLELCQGIPTDKYIAYCMKMVRMLQYFGVKPILVFDGANLPIKREQESTRRERRIENRKKAMECLREGNRTGATEYFQKAVDVTPRMAYNLIQCLKQENVDYIVAPYEADAQMAFLSINGLVHAVITEDSDLIPYGASRILFKMDQTGHGKEFRNEDLQAAREMDLKGWTQSMLRHMCIMAGCDYLEGLNGFGVKKAQQWVKKYRDDMQRIFNLLKADRNVGISDDYETRFKKADMTFKHQRVYDPRNQVIRPLLDLPVELASEELDFIGPPISDDVGIGIATAVLDPQNKRPFEEVIAETLTASTTAATGNTQSSANGAVMTNKNVVAREAIMFQRRRQSTFSESLLGSSPGGKKGQLALPAQANKLDSYFKKSFKPPSSTESQPSSTKTTPSRSTNKNSGNDQVEVLVDGDEEEDGDIDLSNITRDSDDDSAPVYDETFEGLKVMFSPGSKESPRLASSTSSLTPTPKEVPAMRRAATEPALPQMTTKQVILETPPRQVKVVSRFFSGSRITESTTTEDGRQLTVVSDDILEVDLAFMEASEPLPVVKNLTAQFDSVQESLPLGETNSIDSLPQSDDAGVPAALQTTFVAENSPLSSASSAATETQPEQKREENDVGEEGEDKEDSETMQKSKARDLKSLFSFGSQRKQSESPTTSRAQRRLSLPPIDQSKAISLDEDDDDDDDKIDPNNESLFSDPQSVDAEPLDTARPSLESQLTGGIENKENSRTAASSFLARFAFSGSPSSSSLGSPQQRKKRKSPSSSSSASASSRRNSVESQVGASISERLAAFTRKASKTTDTATPQSHLVVIPDSDDEMT